ncbi:MAG: NPCBM/NEW2 domain-containing protein, partial [Sedimentisphaerales bacterium]|nr:NPCBM/NEW2 domain-containing protein [Sedimentisphaerales bacterium]
MSKTNGIILVFIAMCLLGDSVRAATRWVWLDELDISRAVAGWGTTHRNRSVEGNPLRIGGKEYSRGIGTHAPGYFWVRLDGWTTEFKAFVGVDDEVGNAAASVEFKVIGDGKVLWESGVMKSGQAAKEVQVKVQGVKDLVLTVTDAGDGMNWDHTDWAEAQLKVTGQDPITLPPESVKPYILTPKPPQEPRINGAMLFGVRPGSPLLYTIAVTGERPMRFAARGLPAGLRLDADTGQITGSLKEAGAYAVLLEAANARGTTRRQLRIEVGEKICLTPPLGWNSWNCWAGAVDAEKVMASARAMVDTGLVQHGWTYINIDDTWQGQRGGQFQAIQPNEKFPDMKALCDAVHGMGLKIGIYSTPWITSYAAYIGGSSDNEDGAWSKQEHGAPGFGRSSGKRHGKYPFAQNDARQWAAWGMDYLKYDWNPNDVEHVTQMAEALRASGRDIVYSLSNSAPFELADQWARLANCWRTTGDITDTWGSVEGIGFAQDKWTEFAGCGHWNDPDMLVVGKVGWGPNLHPTRLSPDEQYTHISLWCLLSAPLLLGCDLAELDEFTLSLLTNDVVLAVNQDPRGEQARRVAKKDAAEVWAKT